MFDHLKEMVCQELEAENARLREAERVTFRSAKRLAHENARLREDLNAETNRRAYHQHQEAELREALELIASRTSSEPASETARNALKETI